MNQQTIELVNSNKKELEFPSKKCIEKIDPVKDKELYNLLLSMEIIRRPTREND